MNRNIPSIFFLFALVTSNVTWYLIYIYRDDLIKHDIGQYTVEIKQRDFVIEEMQSFIMLQNQGKTHDDLLKVIQDHPKAKEHENYYQFDKDTLEMGMTLKFHFNNGKLVNVYW